MSQPSLSGTHDRCVLESRSVNITAMARRLLLRRVFDLLGAPRGVLWWQTPHPDLGEFAPLSRVYPRYDWNLHDSLLEAGPTAAVFRTVGLIETRATGAKEARADPAPVTETNRPPTAPVWGFHDVDGSSSWWLALMYVQWGMARPWTRRYEEHFMHCEMCVYHVEMARLTIEMFPDRANEAQVLRRAAGPIAPGG